MKKIDFHRIKLAVQKYEIILASVVGLMAIFISVWLLLLPNFIQARKIYSEKEQLEKRLKELEKKDRVLTSIDKERYANIYPKILQVLSEGRDYVSLFSTFDELEKEAQATIIRTDFQMGTVSTVSGKIKKSPDSLEYILPVSIELKGNKEQVSKFIELLRSMKGRLINLDTISFTFNEDSTLKASLVGNAYYYPLKTIGSIESQLPELGKNQEEIMYKIDKNLTIFKLVTAEEDIPIGKKNLFQ